MREVSNPQKFSATDLQQPSARSNRQTAASYGNDVLHNLPREYPQTFWLACSTIAKPRADLFLVTRTLDRRASENNCRRPP